MLFNETNIQFSKKAETIIHCVRDFDKANPLQSHRGHFCRYRVEFIDGTYYESDSKADILSHVRSYRADDYAEVFANVEENKQSEYTVTLSTIEEDVKEATTVEEDEEIKGIQAEIQEQMEDARVQAEHDFVSNLSEYDYLAKAIEEMAHEFCFAVGEIDGVPIIIRRLLKRKLQLTGYVALTYKSQSRTYNQAAIVHQGGLAQIQRFARRGVEKYERGE